MITGGTGQLGQDLVEVLSRNNDVRYCSRKDFDLTDLRNTKHYILEMDPNVIIHSAAYTDVDGCEVRPEKAFNVNSLGTRNVAIASRNVGAKLFYISTDYIFDGDKEERYKEFDIPNPKTVYGKSKLLGEEYVKEQLSDFFIVRIAWLYGKNGNNFVKTMLDLAVSNDKIQVVNDQIGSPTWTKDVARQVEVLLGTEAFGTYHCTSRGSCSWYDFALKIFDLADLEVGVEPISSQELSREAERPSNSVLENYLLELQGLQEMPHWSTSIESFLEEYLRRDN